MARATFTYAGLDAKLRALGFTPETRKGEARIYRHGPAGASIFSPDTSFDEEVLPRHLVAVRHVLREYDLGDLDEEHRHAMKANKEIVR